MLNGSIRRLVSSFVTGSRSQGSSTVGLRPGVCRYNPGIVVSLQAGGVLVVFHAKGSAFVDSMMPFDG
ncbi:hypothetical protein GB937_009609 [Aspergillus fischeri]|nr:hypothetical protein GB937_009609 [Aspergillus fischeri]